MLALALALSALVQDAPAPEPPVQRARAVQWLMHYVNNSDYPPEARRRGEQGRVGYELTIGPHGRPIACRILRSSGSASLDEATCRIMRERARFHPARDAAGNPTVDRVQHSIEWISP